ncbi:MAG: chemotaxis response regulator protein-glutamate methylesterase [Gammaproteobacteria bacterium]|nr:chemotaxis response regulator protein-glutamate methylesterase [Gammaproteobacteria bacterium]MDH5593623.1 chemotaxis response regulator protein-glutamate methylesterase [Gammaproteobacteria bacterium]MDH5614560.1 chemotaxis response regulator protein-glutamate methylesterase [Gammaproteobacteria bacterium]
MSKIKVLIVDDSSLVRKMLTEILSSDRDIEVVGSAADPYMAREKIKTLNPDVLTLDVEMPRMDGLTFLSNLMRLRPMPVVMVSSLTEKGADVTLDALDLGAIDFVSKPKVDLAHTLQNYADEIIEKVKTASKAKVRAIDPAKIKESIQTVPKYSADAVLEKKGTIRNFKTTDKIIAIGASTGGTEAIKEVLMALPADSPGTVITQHIPEAFSGPFASRMDRCSAMTVYEAKDGQQIVPGHVYIAPGDKHLIVERSGARYVCKLSDGPPVNRHRPAVDVMFRSVAQNVGKNAVGVVLTGMGDDGARGLKEIKEAGGPTLVQDEKTSVVWGMPGEAYKIGATDIALPLDKIASKIISLSKEIDKKK